MREIKFRAWDDVKDRMYFVAEEDDIAFELLSSGSFVGHDLTEGWDSPFQRLEHLKFMQYTGLKDKNDIEIFEGDIVRFEYGEPPAVEITSWGHDVIDGWNEEVIGSISYERGAFMLGEHLLWSMEAAGLDYSLEVLGNVHEHPHLLKGE